MSTPSTTSPTRSSGTATPTPTTTPPPTATPDGLLEKEAKGSDRLYVDSYVAKNGKTPPGAKLAKKHKNGTVVVAYHNGQATIDGKLIEDEMGGIDLAALGRAVDDAKTNFTLQQQANVLWMISVGCDNPTAGCSLLYKQYLAAMVSGRAEANSARNQHLAQALAALGGAVLGQEGIGGRTTRPTRPGAAGGGCRNSFDPDTPVLMADGTTKAIKNIQVGDRVLATDPETHTTAPREVAALHRNTDTHLTDLTVIGADGQPRLIHTTQDHPFWDETGQAWVDAGDLPTGHQLRPATTTTTTTTGPATVVKVTNFDGHAIMRNLTIADIHTYYVLAGQTPVLVHNCPDDIRGVGTPKIGPTSGKPNWNDGSVSPGEGWEWRGPGAPGTPNRGAWYNPSTKETLHPDLGHAEPIGPHYDYRAPDGTFYRMFPDGTILAK